MSAKPNIFL